MIFVYLWMLSSAWNLSFAIIVSVINSMTQNMLKIYHFRRSIIQTTCIMTWKKKRPTRMFRGHQMKFKDEQFDDVRHNVCAVALDHESRITWLGEPIQRNFHRPQRTNKSKQRPFDQWTSSCPHQQLVYSTSRPEPPLFPKDNNFTTSLLIEATLVWYWEDRVEISSSSPVLATWCSQSQRWKLKKNLSGVDFITAQQCCQTSWPSSKTKSFLKGVGWMHH